MLTTSLNSTSFTPKIQLAHQLAKMFHNGQIYGDASTDYYSYHVCGVLQLIQVHNLPEEYQSLKHSVILPGKKILHLILLTVQKTIFSINVILRKLIYVKHYKFRYHRVRIH